MKNNNSEYFVDDRIYADDTISRILHMSDEEFEKYLASIKEMG